MQVLALNILALALCLSLGSAAVSEQRPSVRRPDTSLMQFMIDNRAVQAKSPQQSIQCFNYYTPLLNDIANQYEKDYAACYTTASAAEENLNSIAEAARNSLNNIATSSCSAVASCYTLDDVESAFSCYQTVSNNNTKQFYSMSSSAQDDLTNLREQERLIKVEETRCQNECDRAYVQNTDSAYEELQSCLSGLTEVPTTEAPAASETPDTTTTTTTTTTTERPATEESNTA